MSKLHYKKITPDDIKGKYHLTIDLTNTVSKKSFPKENNCDCFYYSPKRLRLIVKRSNKWFNQLYE